MDLEVLSFRGFEVFAGVGASLELEGLRLRMARHSRLMAPLPLQDCRFRLRSSWLKCTDATWPPLAL